MASKLALSVGPKPLILEGDSTIVIMAINQPNLISDWHIDPIIRDIHHILASFPSSKAIKVQRHANLQAHVAIK